VKKIVLVVLSALLALLFSSATANAASPSDRDPIPPPTDYWQDKGFILMAHQGGEWNFPPNTLFAYKSAMVAGADMIDMDAYVTRDGKIVLSHDLDARKNSNLTDDMFEGRHDINDLDLSELKQLDFAYKWKPHGSAEGAEPPFRGIATGPGNLPPEGFTRNDFKIPTFEEVLDAFPDTPINIELKQVGGVNVEDTAETMAGILAANPGHDENVIINSFGQEMLDAMHAARPQHKSFSGSQDGLLGYIQGHPITPTPVAVEPPDYFSFSGNWLRTVPILKPWAVHDGYRIYVWGSDHDIAQDTDPFYAKLIEEGADSYNTPSPLTLATYLCNAGIAKPDGSPRCPAQECPEGQTGIAPDNCVDIPAIKVESLRFKPKKTRLKAGKKRVLTLAISTTDGYGGFATIRLRSSNRKVRVKKSIKLKLVPGETITKRVVVKAGKRARGKAKITARSGKLKTHSILKIKPLKKKRHHRR
jgi:glycerophosphoryl diester phosphodiesterase